MSAIEIEHLIENYLDHIRSALSSVPAERREQIINGIAEHIDEARTDEAIEGPEAVSRLLSRIGTPENIAAAALDEEQAGEDRHPRRRRRWWIGIALLVLCLAGGGTALAVTMSAGPEATTARMSLVASSRDRAVYAVPSASYSIVVSVDRPAWARIDAPADSTDALFEATITPQSSPRITRVSGSSSLMLAARAEAIQVKVGARTVGTITAPSIGFWYEFRPPGSQGSLPTGGQQSASSPPLAVVPNLLGEPLAQAEAQLHAVGMAVIVRPMSNGPQPRAGIVLDQSSAGGSTQPMGAQISLTVGTNSAPPPTATTVVTTQ